MQWVFQWVGNLMYPLIVEAIIFVICYTFMLALLKAFGVNLEKHIEKIKGYSMLLYVIAISITLYTQFLKC